MSKQTKMSSFITIEVNGRLDTDLIHEIEVAINQMLREKMEGTSHPNMSAVASNLRYAPSLFFDFR